MELDRKLHNEVVAYQYVKHSAEKKKSGLKSQALGHERRHHFTGFPTGMTDRC